MGSINGLKNIHATSIQNAGQFYLGNNLDSGAAGQVIISAGPQQAALWGSNSATLPGALTMGTNLSLASGDASFDGTTADTINAAGLSITGGNGISVVGGTEILTDNDNTTINNSGGTGQQNQVLKVPNALTINSTTYDGSVARNFTLATTDTTYTGTVPIAISAGPVGAISLDYDGDTLDLDGADLAVQKVPNTLTFTGYDTGTYDGSTAKTINLENTEYTAGNGIQISGSNQIQTKTDNQTIRDSGGGSGNNLQVIKVPNTLTASTNIIFTNTDDGAAETSYDGSQPITITAASSGTTYDGGTNINIDTSTTPDEINLDTSITGQTGITFLNNGASTNLTGSNYPNKPTTATNLDLTSSTNKISGVVLATKIQQTYMRRDIGTTYIEYSSNFRTSFVAQSASVMVEFYAVIAAYSSKLFYGALYDYINSQFFATSQTQHRFKFDNGLDQDPTSCMWYLTGLTAGTTYYISPYFKSSKATSYIYAGNSGTADSFAPGILRIIDGGNNVDIY